MECSTIYLQRVADGKFLAADLCDEITDEHVRFWEKRWVPPMMAALQEKLRQGVPPDKWPQDLKWDWQTKAAWARKLLGMKTFSVLCAGELEGLMIINSTKEARLPEQRGKPIMYIEFLSTAPWNRREIVQDPRYRGVGRALVLAAVQLSIIEEFKGRIGLHSLPQADEFYAAKCGMTAVERDPKKQNLMYFEMTEEQATTFQSYK